MLKFEWLWLDQRSFYGENSSKYKFVSILQNSRIHDWLLFHITARPNGRAEKFSSQHLQDFPNHVGWSDSLLKSYINPIFLFDWILFNKFFRNSRKKSKTALPMLYQELIKWKLWYLNSASRKILLSYPLAVNREGKNLWK